MMKVIAGQMTIHPSNSIRISYFDGTLKITILCMCNFYFIEGKSKE